MSVADPTGNMAEQVWRNKKGIEDSTSSVQADKAELIG